MTRSDAWKPSQCKQPFSACNPKSTCHLLWMRPRLAFPLYCILLFLFMVAFTTPLAAQPQATPNPDLTPACGLDVVLILDESGSVGLAAQTVRDGARAMLSSLADTGSRVALVEFNAQARAPLGASYLPVTTGPGGTLSTGGAFDDYLNTGYNPTDATNWDGALGLAAEINSNHSVADLVVFFTDGNPNVYVDADGNNQLGDTTTSLNEAVDTANLVKTQGSHIFVVGVGDVTEANLVAVSGPDKLPNPNLPFGQADYTLITFDEFVNTLRGIAFNVCTPYLSVTKVVDEADGTGYQPQAGWALTSAVRVTEGGQALTAFEWLLPTPGMATQVGQSQTLLTNAEGRGQWQWSPGTIEDPKPWTSQLQLIEEDRPNYQFVDATCVRRTLDPANDFVETTFTLTTLPATIDYGPNDVVACTLRNARVALTVEKGVTPTTLPEPGGVVTYTYTVRNTGAATLQLTTLVDERFGDLNGQGTCQLNLPIALETNGIYQCMVSGTLSGNAGDQFDDDVTATATSGIRELTATDNAVVTVTDVLPTAIARKTANPISLPELGGPVTFAMTVTNFSLAESAVVTTLTDAPFGDITAATGAILSTTCSVPQTLAIAGQPNDSYTCRFTANVAGNAGLYRDTITAVVQDDEGNVITPMAEATVTLTDVPSSIRVTKTPNRGAVPEPGGDVVFTILVENTSSVDRVEIREVVDSQVDLPANSCDVPLPAILAVNGNLRCQYTVSIQGNQGDLYTNEVVVTGIDDDNQPVSDQDQATVPITNLPSSLLVTKQAHRTIVPEPGAQVTYTVRIQNTSLADTVTITSVVDSRIANAATFCEAPLPVALPPNATLQCSYSLLVQGDVGDIVVNRVTAVGRDDDGNLVTASDQEEVRITDVPSALQVVKAANPSAVPETGGTVTYTVTIKNISAVDVVTVTQVTDDLFGDVSTDCLPTLPARLGVNDEIRCQFVRDLSGDVGQAHTNIVTATGIDDEGLSVLGTGEATVAFTDVAPMLAVTKTATPQRVLETGGMVTFAIEVRNTGLEQLTLVDLQDDLFGDLNGRGTCFVPQVLSPNNLYRCTFAILVQGTFGNNHVNVVTAYAQDNEGTVVMAADQATVDLLDAAPDLVVTKEDALLRDNPNDPPSHVATVSPGDILSYTVVIHNQGNQGATNVIFDDVPDQNSQLIVGSVRTSKGIVQVGNVLGETKVTIAIGDLGINERVTVEFQVRVTEGTGVNRLVNQAEIVSFDPTQPGGQGQTTLSDDPETPEPNDATVTEVSIPPTGLNPEEEPSSQPYTILLPLIQH